jgi:hypothetical protein
LGFESRKKGRKSSSQSITHKISVVEQAAVRFGILGHRADDVVVSDSGG